MHTSSLLRAAIVATLSGAAAGIPVAVAAEQSTGEPIEEVLVTAQYREERLQDVPTSITALNAEALRLSGASTLKDLQNLVPNVQFAGESFSGNPKVVIRGLYINTRTTGLEPSFGVYVDGVFQGRPIAYNIDLVDIERIEYLRGPQGSLYGKNTISGAINIVTQKPGDVAEGFVTADLGNLGYGKFAGTWRGPLTESVGFKVTGYHVQDDGYVENIGPGGDIATNDRTGGSAMLRITPNENFEILFGVDAMSEDRGVYFGESSSAPLGGAGPFNAAGPLPIGAGFVSLFEPGVASTPYLVDLNYPQPEKRGLKGANLTLNYKVGDYGLTSITAWRDAFNWFAVDDDYNSFDMNRAVRAEGKFDQFTQEFRVTSPEADRFNYIAGIFFMHSNISQTRLQRTGDGTQVLSAAQNAFLGTVRVPATGSTWRDVYNFYQQNDSYFQDSSGVIDSYALYGQANYGITDTINAFAGLRYSIEDKRALYQQTGFRNNVPIAAGITSGTAFGAAGRTIPLFATQTYRDSKLSPSAGVQWQATPDINVFVRYAQGFKGTGFNFGNGIGNTTTQPPTGPRGAPGAIALLPEEVDSYEVGIKTQWLARRLTANLTLWKQEGKNLQISAFLPDLTRPAFNTNAELQGFELELAAVPNDNMRFTANVGYTDTICVGGGPAGAITGASRFNATCTKGVDLENVSKVNAAATATLTFPVSDRMRLVTYGEVTYRDDFLGGSYYIDGYTLLNARIGIEYGGWGLFAYGKNLTDETTNGNSFGSSAGSNAAAAVPANAYEFIETYQAPRTFGVSFEYRF
jgi:iron complex outermembrane receptor protein